MQQITFTLRDLLEAGVHFGHHPRRWNPKMAPYIYGERNKVHIIDLQITAPLLHRALKAITEVVAKGGRILFVGTKRQASQKIAEAAKACGQYYINHRWLGGTLTNWSTISKSIKKLEDFETKLSGEASGLTKKEALRLSREKLKLDLALGGIRSMGGRPDLVVVIDTNKEAIAIEEAAKLNIPVVAVLDTNSSPEGITYPVPGNDDAGKAIDLYCKLFVEAVLQGLQVELSHHDKDLGDAEDVEDLKGDDFSDMVGTSKEEENLAEKEEKSKE